MGARGPKGKPAAQKRLEGNPGCRPIPDEYVEPAGTPRKPSHLNGYALTVWRRVVASMPTGVYAASDTEALAAYCLAAAELKRAMSHLDIEGRVIMVETKQGTIPKRNPWGQIAREAMQQIATLGTRLGLDPMARENIKAPDKRPKSKFEGLVSINGGKK